MMTCLIVKGRNKEDRQWRITCQVDVAKNDSEAMRAATNKYVNRVMCQLRNPVVQVESLDY